MPETKEVKKNIEEEVPQEDISQEEQPPVEEEVPQEDISQEEEVPQAPTDPTLQNPNMGGLPGDMGIDPEEPPITLPDVIRKYELKKIYVKLHAIENFLFNNNVFTKKISTLQKNVSIAIDLFDFIVENLTVYRKKADKIIDIFNKFINDTTKLLKKYTAESEE